MRTAAMNEPVAVHIGVFRRQKSGENEECLIVNSKVWLLRNVLNDI